MVELGLLGGDADNKVVEMHHNKSGKFESEFVSLRIPRNNSVMLGSLAGCTAGIWVAHGEGRFVFKHDYAKSGIKPAAHYLYDEYPGNPNGSEGAVAAITSADGRHLALMPHLERAIFPWQCAWTSDAVKERELTIWYLAFENARRWIARQIGK